MIHKNARPKWRKLLGPTAVVLFVAEALSFVGCYKIWHKLNTERDFRLYMKDNCPKVLDSYYSFGEYMGGTDIRQIDNEYWSKQPRSSM